MGLVGLYYKFFLRETIGESRYNLADLLKSQPPISEQEEPKKYTISEDVKKMQRMMQKLYTKQKEKGGIIDLEAEGKKFLVVTNSGNDEEEDKFTELSPTDYQLGTNFKAMMIKNRNAFI